MNRRALSLFLLPGCMAAAACGVSADGHDPVSSDESSVQPSTVDGGTDGDAADAGPGIDFSAVPMQIADNEGQGALAMSGLATLLNVFLPPAHGMDVTATPDANAALIAANLQGVACSTAKQTYTSGAEYLLVDFGSGCQLGNTNVVVGGVVQVGVTGGVTGDGIAVAWAALQLKGAVVAGYTVDGFANVATTATSQSIDSRVTVAGLGTMSFDGTSSPSRDDASVVILNGTGVFTGAKYTTPTNSDGVSCVSSAQSVIGFRQVRQSPSECFAHKGTLDVRTAYVCRVASAPPEAGFTTTVSFANVLFDSWTAASGAAVFSVTAPGRVDDDGTPTTATAILSAAACSTH